ncbi:MAG TPA: YkgJ family cysteine cluster protein [Kofleriaceae bacterium]|nr:YkgJ family cysteine cluster protein [Kofleriaceae bacterium]
MSPPVRTLGEFVRDEGVLDWLAGSIGRIIDEATAGVREGARRKLVPVASCFSCTTPWCCSKMVIVGLHEGVLIASSLRAAQRDTPELRAELRARAEAMAGATPTEWSRPCAFLDERGRCSVYAVRPRPCGTLYVFSPPEWCRGDDPDRNIRVNLQRREKAEGEQIEEQFRERLALRKKVGRRYIGTIPHMVLVALEAWDRTDFRDYLRQLPWPTIEEAQRWAPPDSV